jgi:hypothetical protein
VTSLPPYLAARLGDARGEPPSIKALMDELIQHGWRDTLPSRMELGPFALDSWGNADRHAEMLERVAPLGLSIAPVVLGKVVTRENLRFVVVRQPQDGQVYHELRRRPATEEALERALHDLERLWGAGWRCPWVDRPGAWRVAEPSGALVYDQWGELVPVDPRQGPFDPTPIREGLAPWIRPAR